MNNRQKADVHLVDDRNHCHHVHRAVAQLPVIELCHQLVALLNESHHLHRHLHHHRNHSNMIHVRILDRVTNHVPVTVGIVARRDIVVARLRLTHHIAIVVNIVVDLVAAGMIMTIDAASITHFRAIRLNMSGR